MFSEIMTQMRHNHDELHTAITKVDDNLRDHVRDEMGQYSQVRAQLQELRDDVVSLKTKMGALSAGISAVVAAVVAWGGKVFFS